MANTFTQIYIHFVFSVKGRQNLIQKSWKDELHKYICGIVDGKDQKVYAIGGMADHIHLLVSIKPTIAISDLVRDIKANSSKWINEKKNCHRQISMAGRFWGVFVRTISAG